MHQADTIWTVGHSTRSIDEFIALLQHYRIEAVAEVLWWRCHRSLIADVLMTSGTRVLHIQDEGHIEEHPYTRPARLHRGQLTYQAGLGEPLNARERSQGVQQQLDF